MIAVGDRTGSPYPSQLRRQQAADTRQLAREAHERQQVLVHIVRDIRRRLNARVYVYNNKPFKRVASFRDAQAAAQAAPRGIWKNC